MGCGHLGNNLSPLILKIDVLMISSEFVSPLFSFSFAFYFSSLQQNGSKNHLQVFYARVRVNFLHIFLQSYQIHLATVIYLEILLSWQFSKELDIIAEKA